MEAAVRLQKIIAQAGVASRRAAEGLILAGRVRVNGRVCRELGTRALPRADRIEVDGLGLMAPEPAAYIMLHKPEKVLSAAVGGDGRATVIDVLQASRAIGPRHYEGQMPRVYPVGRLDFDAEGLLLLTNDGALTQALLHPRYHVPKTYMVKVSDQVEERNLARLRAGVRLREVDGRLSRPTAPADVHVVRSTAQRCWLEITIVEGRNRQIKRMCDSIGHPVQRLIRTEFAGLELGDLPAGAWRFLTSQERQQLRGWQRDR